MRDGGAPGRTRTCDHRLRRPMLYPAELLARTDSRVVLRCADDRSHDPRPSPAEVVGVRGFEPPASCSQSRRATRLRHTPKVPILPVSQRFFKAAAGNPGGSDQATTAELCEERPHGSGAMATRVLFAPGSPHRTCSRDRVGKRPNHIRSRWPHAPRRSRGPRSARR